MNRGRRSLGTTLPLSQSLIIIVVVGALFIFSYTLVDRYVVRQKMGDLMNLADAKYVHVLDLLDLGQRLRPIAKPTMSTSAKGWPLSRSRHRPPRLKT